MSKRKVNQQCKKLQNKWRLNTAKSYWMQQLEFRMTVKEPIERSV